MNRARWLKTFMARHPDWDVDQTKGEHLRWRHRPSGKLVFTGGTPSDHRAFKNIEAMLKRVERGGEP